MNDLQASMLGINSLIHAAGHIVPERRFFIDADVQALRDDVREAIVAIYCDHDEQAARRVRHARWLLRETVTVGAASSMHLEEAAFHLRLHHPWEALSALRQASDALLSDQLSQGERS